MQNHELQRNYLIFCNKEIAFMGHLTAPLYHPFTRNDQPPDVNQDAQQKMEKASLLAQWLGGFTSPTDTGRNRVSKPL